MKKVYRVIRRITSFFMAFVLIALLLLSLFPWTRFVVLAGIGANLTLFGYNYIGPKIYKIGLDQKKVTGGELRAFSVQNSKNGNYDIAIDALRSAVEKDNEVKGYYGWLLLYYYHDYARALNTLNEYDSLTPGFTDAVVGENIKYLKGLALTELGRNGQALKEFNQYITETTLSYGEEWVDVYAFVNKGIVLTELGEHEEAIESYNTAIRIYADCTEAYYFRAKALINLNKIEKALVDAKKANDLIQQGYKHRDPYVELFEEIYPIQVKRLITQLENRLK